MLLLKVLLFIFLFYYLTVFFVRYLLPYFLKRHIRKTTEKFYNTRNQNMKSNVREGEVSIDYNREKTNKRRGKDNLGEFVDYQEIKD